VVLTPYRDILVAGSRPLLLVLLGAVFAVLLIACTNIANLLLAGLRPGKKRLLSASPWGGPHAPGATVAYREPAVGNIWWLAGYPAGMGQFGRATLVVSTAPARETVVHLDPRILVFAALLSLLTGIVFGLAPVLQVLRGNLHDRLKQGADNPVAPAGSGSGKRWWSVKLHFAGPAGWSRPAGA